MRNWDSCMFPLFTLHGSGTTEGQEASACEAEVHAQAEVLCGQVRERVQCSGCGSVRAVLPGEH